MGERIVTVLNAAAMSGDCNFSSTCAVVIDVLRATSVMTTAAANGAKQIFTRGEVSEARELAELEEPALLCGERHCKKIDGFDFGNSPSEYTTDRVDSSTLILTTTNGTRAINAVKSARRVLVGSFLNLESVVQAVREERRLALICAGTNGELSYEDVLLAGAIAHASARDRQLDDSTRLAQSAWRHVLEDSGSGSLDSAVARCLAESLGGRNLIQVGFGDDVQRCASLNTISGHVERVDAGQARFEFRTTSD